MRPFSRLVALAGLVGASVLIVRGPAWAQEGSQPARSARGGLVARTAHHQFEVFFYPSGVRVLPETAAGGPVDVSRVTGTATFYHPNSPRPWFTRPLRGTPGESPATLDLAIGLGNAPAAGGRVTFELSGLPDPSEPQATFTVPLEFVAAPPASGPPTVVVPPPPPQGGTATAPRYLYSPGYYGYGYYQNTSPGPLSRPAGPHNPATTPGMFGPGGMIVGPYHRDWSAGRDLPLAKPWLRPRD